MPLLFLGLKKQREEVNYPSFRELVLSEWWDQSRPACYCHELGAGSTVIAVGAADVGDAAQERKWA